jgi:hypothetical protein
MGVPPNHPFINRIVHILGYPHLWKHPYRHRGIHMVASTPTIPKCHGMAITMAKKNVLAKPHSNYGGR